MKVFEYGHARKHIEMTFAIESEKLKFESKLDQIRQDLGCKTARKGL